MYPLLLRFERHFNFVKQLRWIFQAKWLLWARFSQNSIEFSQFFFLLCPWITKQKRRVKMGPKYQGLRKRHSAPLELLSCWGDISLWNHYAFNLSKECSMPLFEEYRKEKNESSTDNRRLGLSSDLPSPLYSFLSVSFQVPILNSTST